MQVQSTIRSMVHTSSQRAQDGVLQGWHATEIAAKTTAKLYECGAVRYPMHTHRCAGWQVGRVHRWHQAYCRLAPLLTMPKTHTSTLLQSQRRFCEQFRWEIHNTLWLGTTVYIYFLTGRFDWQVVFVTHVSKPLFGVSEFHGKTPPLKSSIWVDVYIWPV